MAYMMMKIAMMIIPIYVTLVGMVTDVSDSHDWKAPSPGNSMVRVSINTRND